MYQRPHLLTSVTRLTSIRSTVDRGRHRLLAGDRKSTRLNSSHLVISYAVFCLKKKKDRYCLQYLHINQHQHYDHRVRKVHSTLLHYRTTINLNVYYSDSLSNSTSVLQTQHSSL